MLEYLPHVYAVALAASYDEETAQAVTEHVFEEAIRGDQSLLHDRRRLAAHAIRFAMRAAPADCFAAMAPSCREAVALARLGGCSIDEIALTLDVDPAEAKRRLRGGLEGLALEAQALAS